MTARTFSVRRRTVLLASAAVLAAALATLAGCSTLGYYAQSIEGHLAVLHAARPIDDWLADPATPEALRHRLEEVRVMRRFASEQLGLPDNSSYREYADLKRPYVVWNVFAAPAVSLQLRSWCFPVAGCVNYRGYFDRADADHYAAALRESGWDVQVGGVPAYSTLGWTADPVLSTFIQYPEGEVARLIFHELAHQRVYAAGDSTFNESFATAVEEEGVKRWLAYRADPALNESYRLFATRKKAFLALLTDARDRLAQAYAAGPDDAARRAAKLAAFADLRSAYAAAKNDPASALYHYAGYDRYFAQDLNNAHLGAIAAYTQRLPAFARLLQNEGGDLPRFYSAVQSLAKLGKTERDGQLDALQAAAP